MFGEKKRKQFEKIVSNLQYVSDREHHIGILTKAWLKKRDDITANAEADKQRILDEYHENIIKDYKRWKQTASTLTS